MQFSSPGMLVIQKPTLAVERAQQNSKSRLQLYQEAKI
jgi:hypothetical protein